ncbi:MAG TPA: ATP-binding cassette domain-containing protein [Gammaproteobacteria bacterium]|nr:ATP-binding cassette domain-containing protein [Gammaproteobacteria bacterium]
MSECLLTLRDYGVAFGDKIVLNGVNLQIPPRGIVVLMGPVGTGKSTLLRTLSGANDGNPSLRTWGEVEFAGAPLGQGELPALVAQKTRLMMASIRENIVNDMPERHSLDLVQQRDVARRLLNRAGLHELSNRLNDNVVDFPLAVQRHLAIARCVAANPKLMFVDEPTTGLNDEDAQRLLDYLSREAEQRAIVVVLHNQKQALQLGGSTALLAGGWIHEMQNTADFFVMPKTPAARDFVNSGSCSVPSPGTPKEHLDDTYVEQISMDEVSQSADTYSRRPDVPEVGRKFKNDAFGPRNFLWLRKGELAGTPRPGLFVDLEYDLAALRRVGITVLVSLTASPIAPDKLAPFEIQGVAFPIEDMGAPTIEASMMLCAQVAKLIAQGEAVAMHCKAGMGRTGTMLAAQLIWEGQTALDALNTARRIEPRWVQSETQVRFLEAFATALAVGNKERRVRSS